MVSKAGLWRVNRTVSKVDEDQRLEELRNLGPASARMLAAAGIRTARQLAGLGSVSAFLAVKSAGHAPSFNLLWRSKVR